MKRRAGNPPFLKEGRGILMLSRGRSPLGRDVFSEMVKTSLIDLSPARSIGKSYCFAGFGVVQEVFPGSIRIVVRCVLRHVEIYCLAGSILHRYLRAFHGAESNLSLTVNWWISGRLSLTMSRKSLVGWAQRFIVPTNVDNQHAQRDGGLGKETVSQLLCVK
jgi:hypothetical protein